MTALHELLAELQFQRHDDASAYGDIDGCAVKLTVLNDEPLSVLIAFYVGSNGTELPADLGPLPAAEKSELSLEDGFVWLSLWNLIAPVGEELAQSIRQIVNRLKGAGFALDSQCGLCGDQNVQILLLDGRVVRICGRCLESKQRETEELNRPNAGQAIFIPLGILAVAVAWAVVWVLIDLLLDWLNAGQVERVLEINTLTLVPFAASGALLFMVALKLGDWLWNSGLSRRSPMMLSIIVVLTSILLGEFVYITIAVWRQMGLLNIAFVSQIFFIWLQEYNLGWIIFKICLIACVFFGCLAGAGKKVAAKLV